MAASAVPKLKRKLIVMLAILCLLFFLLALRLTQVMIFQGAELQEKAMSQWTRRTQLTAQRGRIMDRTGLVLAQSGTSYRVLVNPQWINKDERVRISIELSDILGLDYDYVLERVSNTNRQQVQLKRKVSAETVAQITALQFGSGVSFSTDMKRYYPFGQLFAQLVGFSGVDGEGQTGIEAELNSYLAGENGLLVTETDRKNQPIKDGKEQYIAPVNGYDVTLTVDSVPQSYLEKALEECYQVNRASTASGIIMNPKTGEILAEATYPSFDLNNPPRDDVTSLMSMSRSRIATDTFEPGSIFKIVTLAAALDSGAVTMDTTFDCEGYKTFRLERVRCANGKKHGHQTLTQAVENSCNCAFMEMAAAMGVDTLYDYIYAFGFDEETGCGIPGEDTGEVTHRKYIRESDLARISFGQSITMTGVQIASAACAAINGGILYQPYIVSSIVATDGTVIEENQPTELRRVIRAETSEKVRAILQSVVDNGSGSNAKMEGYTVGGKTGTAQKYDENGAVSRTRLIASFIGFLPADDPELLCLITVDEPQIPVVYGSTVAAPFVKKTFTDLVQYYGILPNTQNTTKEVPNMIGRTGAMAQDILESEGFEALMAESEEEATVVTQIPAPGEMVPRGTIVVLYTTMTTFNDEGVYKEMSTVPDLIGERRQNAFDKATDAGLTINYDRSACWGIVETQSIPEGTRVEPGTEIFLTFVPHEKQLKDIKSWQAGETESEGANDGTGGNANTTGDAGFAGNNSDVQDVPNQN